jgi:hypothetical protein
VKLFNRNTLVRAVASESKARSSTKVLGGLRDSSVILQLLRRRTMDGPTITVWCSIITTSLDRGLALIPMPVLPLVFSPELVSAIVDHLALVSDSWYSLCLAGNHNLLALVRPYTWRELTTVGMTVKRKTEHWPADHAPSAPNLPRLGFMLRCYDCEHRLYQIHD